LPICSIIWRKSGHRVLPLIRPKYSSAARSVTTLLSMLPDTLSS